MQTGINILFFTALVRVRNKKIKNAPVRASTHRNLVSLRTSLSPS